MKEKNAENWSPKPSEESQNSKLTLRVGSLGTIPDSSEEYEPYKIRASRENCNASNSVVTGQQLFDGVDGKLVRRLVSETEKQLAHHEEQSQYHHQQAELLRNRLEELKRIPETLRGINHTE